MNVSVSQLYFKSFQGKITNETSFYLWLSEFLHTSGVSYLGDIRTENETGHNLIKITVVFSHFFLLFKGIYMSGEQTRVRTSIFSREGLLTEL